MAITLEELLGKNTRTESVESFPSTYEEFQSRRNLSYNQVAQENSTRYDFDVRPATPARSESSVREYEASRPYVAPKASEYQVQDYSFYSQMQAPARPTFEQPQYQEIQREYPQAKTQSLYQFTAYDQDRLSESELFEKLAHTNDSRRPIFDREQAVEQVKKPSVFSRNVAKSDGATKTRGRLNTKGKLILGAYIGVVALVAVLIIVNASKLNAGKATTPSSSVQDYATVQTVDIEK